MSARRQTAPLLAALGVAVAALAMPSSGGAATPCLLTEATRIQTFRINLDGDRALERIDVFNFDAAATPTTMFQVCDLRRGSYFRGQRTVVNESPGNRQSGLRQAWVGDLNRDQQVEIAVRDYLTASAGEVLSIYRQTARHARTFRVLQRIPGDRATLTRHSGSAATITVQLKANHARDGQAHSERWTFAKALGKWACTADCGGRGR